VAVRPLVVSHTGAAGGSNDVILGLLRNAPPDVRPVCVFLDDGPAVEAVRTTGFEARVVRAGRARDLRRMASAIRALVGLIRALRSDVVFAHASKAQVYAGFAAMTARVPNVWYQHELPGSSRAAPGMNEALQEAAARLPTKAVICNSSFVAQAQARRWPRMPVRRIHPGVRTEGVEAHTHTAAGDARIVVVGRLQRWKRVELALEAMRLVLAEQPRARLRIVGEARHDLDVDYPGELRARALSLGIADAVEFAGAVPVVDQQLAGADVVLHVADREAFGLFLIEALLRGIPVVTPPVGGGSEIIRDGVDGLLVEPTNSTALARSLLGLIADPARRTAMGAAGRARALEVFDERRTAAETWRLVDDVTSGPASRS
jgi:glycosyltransferase involved in cell wall biosynthesis